MQSWRTLARRTVLDYGWPLVVEEHTVELPDGQVIDEWPWLITPDYANVLVQTVDGDFLCFQQTKYGVEGTTLAVVGGYLEPGEDPLVGAKRELLEETGCEASEWVRLGNYRVDGNRGAGMAHLYLARNARHVTEPMADDLEEQKLLRLTRSDLEEALHSGAFKVLPWATTVALGLGHVEAE